MISLSIPKTCRSAATQDFSKMKLSVCMTKIKINMHTLKRLTEMN